MVATFFGIIVKLQRTRGYWNTGVIVAMPTKI